MIHNVAHSGGTPRVVPNRKRRSEVTHAAYTADVLVVGGGGAGCRAAVEAHDRGASVVMIVKGRLGHSGCTYNVGTSAAVGPWGDPDDTTDSAMRDLLSHGGFLGNQDLAKILVEEAADSVRDLERWGIDFERDDEGRIAMHWTAAHSRTRNLAFKPRPGVEFDYGLRPGFAMMDVLIDQVRKRGIRVLDDVTLVELLTNEDAVVGAVALDCARNELVVIKASSTILATGTYSQIFAPTTVDRFETGDGQAAAFRAGAELIDMESTQFVSTSIGFPPGSKFLNTRGEQFLERYGIVNPRTVTKEELCYAIGMEIQEGRATERGAIYIDLTEPLNDGAPDLWVWLAKEHKERPGAEDPWKEPVQSTPQMHTTIGGVRVNTRCETNVPGLYCAGGGAGGVYGHARPEGYTSMITLVFGRRAGVYAAQRALEAGGTTLDDAQAEGVMNRARALVSGTEGARADAFKDELRQAMRRCAWVFKDEAGLREGLEAVERIRSSFSTLAARDGYEWESALELPNMLLTAELMLRCSLERKESRGAFFRTDYPNTDDVRWLRNIVVRREGEDISTSAIPVDLKYCGPAPGVEPVRLHVGKGS